MDLLSGCPSGDDVLAFVDRRLGVDAAERVADHVEGCGRCRAIILAIAAERHTDSYSYGSDDLAAAAPAAGARIGRYVISHVVGVGGMGVVYAASDSELERRVAIKLLRSDTTVPLEVLRGRLLREAQAMARLSHPNVITVHEVGTHEGHVYLAMEYLDGGTLGSWLRAEKRPWRDIVRAFVAAGRGLAAAHGAGLVHRDFKPDNVLVRKDGRFCVGDFGLARASEDSDGAFDAALLSRPLDERLLTRTGAVVGTPGYMAPEQARGHALDGRSDQFSFCVALYEALFDVRPFAGSTLAERLESIARGPLTPPRTGVPRHVVRALERGLAAAAESRFPTMDALLDALEKPPMRSWWMLLPAGAAVTVAGLALLHWRHPEPPARATVTAVRRLTFAPGCESMPSFAPDGKTLFYGGETADGERQVFALDVDQGGARQLTHRPGAAGYPVVSPDGRRVAYVLEHDGARRLRVMSRDGSGARDVTPLYAGGKAAWRTPTLIQAYDRTANVGEWNVDEPAAPPRIIKLPGDKAVFTTMPFRDGALALDWKEDYDHLAIGILDGGKLRVLAEHLPFVDGGVVVAPSQRALYFPRRNGAVNELMRVARDGGEPQALPVSVAPSYGVSIARDGRKLAFSTCKMNDHAVRIGDDGAVSALVPFGDWSDDAPVETGHRRALFKSNRSGREQIFGIELDSGRTWPLTAPGNVDLGGVSHDGRLFVYASDVPAGLWIRAVDGSGEARRVTTSGDDIGASFTRDDKQLVFLRWHAGVPHIFIVDVDGKNERQLVAQTATYALTAADDDRVVFLAKPPGSSPRLMVTDRRGTTPVAARAPAFDLAAGNFWSLSRSPDGKRILYLRAGYQLVEVAIDSEAPPVVRYEVPRYLAEVSYAADGRHALATAEFGEGDIWLAEGNFP